MPRSKRSQPQPPGVHGIRHSESPISKRLTCAGGHSGPPLRRGFVTANASRKQLYAGLATRCEVEQPHRPAPTDPQTSLRKHVHFEQATTLQVKRGVRRRPESTYAPEPAVTMQTKSSWVSWWRPETNSERNQPRCPKRNGVNLNFHVTAPDSPKQQSHIQNCNYSPSQTEEKHQFPPQQPNYPSTFKYP
jgi:hypothetical protein